MTTIDLRQPDDVRYVCPGCGMTLTLSAKGAKMFEDAATQAMRRKPKCAKCKRDLERVHAGG